MTKEREMPDKVYIWGCPRSIGDMGFTVTEPKDGHVEYIRADLVNRPAEPLPEDRQRALDDMFERLYIMGCEMQKLSNYSEAKEVETDLDGWGKELVSFFYNRNALSAPAVDVEGLRKQSESAYCKYLDLLDRHCRGAEYKIDNSEFTLCDLQKHTNAKEYYGFHCGVNYAIKLIIEKG